MDDESQERVEQTNAKFRVATLRISGWVLLLVGAIAGSVLIVQATHDAQEAPLDRAAVGIGVVLIFIGLTGMAILRGLASLAEGAERQRRMLADQAKRSSPSVH